MYKNKVGISLLFLMVAFQGFSQFNVKIGYGLGFTQASTNNAILQSSNAMLLDTVDFENTLPDLTSVYGIVLGFRLKVTENNAFELTWENMARKRSSLGVFTISDNLFQQELTYTFNQFYFSYQSQFNRLGLGSGIGINNARIKREIGNSGEKKTIVSDSQYFARFNLSYNIESNRSVALSIQPYFQLPITSVDLTGLVDFLDLPEQDNTAETFPMFGISFVFYNGRQE